MEIIRIKPTRASEHDQTVKIATTTVARIGNLRVCLDISFHVSLHQASFYGTASSLLKPDGGKDMYAESLSKP